MDLEIISRGKGEFLTVDGTFKSAPRTMGNGTCLYLILGDHATIDEFVVVTSENMKDLSHLLKKKRIAR